MSCHEATQDGGAWIGVVCEGSSGRRPSCIATGKELRHCEVGKATVHRIRLTAAAERTRLRATPAHEGKARGPDGPPPPSGARRSRRLARGAPVGRVHDSRELCLPVSARTEPSDWPSSGLADPQAVLRAGRSHREPWHAFDAEDLRRPHLRPRSVLKLGRSKSEMRSVTRTQPELPRLAERSSISRYLRADVLAPRLQLSRRYRLPGHPCSSKKIPCS